MRFARCPFTEKLRGNRDDRQQVHALAGMRRTAQSMKKVPGHLLIGPKLAALMEDALMT